MKTQALVFLSFLAVSANADCSGFGQSCNFEAMNRVSNQEVTIVANCRNTSGSVHVSYFNLNDIIANDDGQMHWRRGGGLAGSCKDFYMDRDTLTANCRRRDGNYNHAQLFLGA